MGGFVSAIGSVASTVLPAITGVTNLLGSFGKSEKPAAGTAANPYSLNNTITINIPKRLKSINSDSPTSMLNSDNKKDWEKLKAALNSRDRFSKESEIFENVLKEQNVSEGDILSFIDMLFDNKSPLAYYGDDKFKRIVNVLNILNNLFF